MTQRVYLDNHATTPMDRRVVEAMLPYFTEAFGNPGSIGHAFGEEAREAVDRARGLLASLLNISPNELVFTSGASEANNLAIRGIAQRFADTKGHLVSVTTEHKAVLDPLQRLARSGFEVTLLEPEQQPSAQAGWLDPDKVANALRDETRLVTVMLANNEVGVIQPIAEIAAVCHQRGVLLHCDATQAVGKIPLDIAALDADMVSFSGHKLYGPRGMGGLIVRRRRPRIRLLPQIEGGGQEGGRRSGTPNVPGIVGLACAVDLCHKQMQPDLENVTRLRDDLYERLCAKLDGLCLNGPHFGLRLGGNLNLQFRDVDGEALMLNLGPVAVSSGSACTSANPEPSHVLRALGLDEDSTRSSLRFGIGRFNCAEDIDIAVETLVKAVDRLRSFRSG